MAVSLSFTVSCVRVFIVARLCRRPWTFNKGMFFFVRYFGVLNELYVSFEKKSIRYAVSWRCSAMLFVGTDLADSFHYTVSDCKKWNAYRALCILLLMVTTNYILVMRSGNLRALAVSIETDWFFQYMRCIHRELLYSPWMFCSVSRYSSNLSL